MTRRSALTVFVGFFASTILLSGCFNPKELENVKVTYTPSATIPLVNSELDMREIVDTVKNNVQILVAPDGFITLEYFGEVFSQSAAGFIVIPDQSLPIATVSIPAIPAVPGGQIVNFDRTDSGFIDLGVPNSGRFSEVVFKSGNLEVRFSSDIPFPHSVELVLPNFTSAGQPLRHTYVLPAGPVLASHTFALSGVRASLTAQGQRNRFAYQLRTTGSYPSSAGVAASSFTAGAFVFGTPAFSLIRGFFGQVTVPISESAVSIGLFGNVKAGDIVITNPSIQFLLRNSFGFPVSVLVNPISVVSNELGTIPVTGPFFGSPVAIAFPLISQIGSSDTTRVLVNALNSNIVNVFSSAPRRLNYGLQLSTNDPNPNADHFITDTSVIKVDARVTLPAEGLIRIFNLADTFDLSLEDAGIDEKNLRQALLRVYMQNSFPMDVDVQIYFLDSGITPIDSLLNTEARVITSGLTNANGIVTTPTTRITDIIITPVKFAALKKAKRIVVSGRVKTTNNGNQIIKIYNDSRLVVRLGLQADLIFE